jgi:uncharacterized protein YqjF (DUF2071 family)
MTEPISALPPESVPHASMIQRWTTSTFLHWRVEPEHIRGLVPGYLHVDVFDGSAWIGLVPFEMAMRPPFVPRVPYLSRYPETNVRTYVYDACGRRGLWFLSLDVPRSVTVLAARTGFQLPYAWSRMWLIRGERTVEYRADCLAPNRGVHSRVVVPWRGGAEDHSELAHFLTGRFRMFGQGHFGPYVIRVEHEPWPLRSGSSVQLEDDLVRTAGLSVPHQPDHVLVSDGVHVRVGFPGHLRP